MTPISSLDGLGDEHVLTVQDVAAILRMSPVKIYEMLSSGTIEGCFRVGRSVRICVKDVRAWIARERLPHNQNIHNLRKGVA